MHLASFVPALLRDRPAMLQPTTNRMRRGHATEDRLSFGEWNSLAIDGSLRSTTSAWDNVSTLASTHGRLNNQGPEDVETPSDELAEKVLHACNNGSVCDGLDSDDQRQLARSIIFVRLMRRAAQVPKAIECPRSPLMHDIVTDKASSNQPCKWALKWVDYLTGYQQRNNDTWQRLVQKAPNITNVTFAVVGHDEAIEAVREGDYPEQHTRMVSQVLGMHVLWYSAPTRFLSDDPCTHIVPTPYELKSMGMLTTEGNAVFDDDDNWIGTLPPWEQRVPMVFYRGTEEFNPQRSLVFRMGRKSVNEGWLNATANQSVTVDTFGHYKYALDIGGKSGTTWNALRNKLRMGSLVLRVDSGFADWWHDEIKAGVHYLRVAPDLSNLQAQFEWAQANPREARRIALAGQAKEAETSTWQAIDKVTTRLLESVVEFNCKERSRLP